MGDRTPRRPDRHRALRSGAPDAVLVAEEFHASGCRLVISGTTAGQIVAIAEPPYFVLIEQAWRDEGTSLHLPPAQRMVASAT
jgi:hypothetical protein